jgi:riboflavin synthase
MFTGMVLGTGEIVSRKAGRDTLLFIQPSFTFEEPLMLGESISVSGACLTVEKVLPENAFSAYASEETLSKTTLARQKFVNLERALRLSDRLGGHLVSGHVDGVGTLISKKSSGQSLVLEIKFPESLLRHLVPKGSVAIDGVSLTVNSVSQESFYVNIVPSTQASTTLKDLSLGDLVNLETDLLAKYLERLLAGKRPPGTLSLEKLLSEGF